jgi:hypothetical protein
MMRRILLVGLCLVMVACGSSKKQGGDCTATGTMCMTDDECCTGNCDDISGQCARIPGQCVMGGEACQAGPDCCSFSCVNGSCSGDQCKSDNTACGGDSECCGGVCSNGTCAPLNPVCKTSGNTCADHGDCCSHYCLNNVCSNSPSFCVQSGDTCTTDAECCGGMCAKTGNAALGLCQTVPSNGATGCAGAGEVCGDGATYAGGPLPTCGGECCSRACFPYGPTGVLVCQPPSGCHPTGELCTKDTDCCGAAGLPDGDKSDVHCEKVGTNTVGRCDNGHACSPAGAICRLQSIQCNANADCCAGNVLQNDTCHQDNLGIPRCLGAEIDCTDPQTHVGMMCATSADCCGLPCTLPPGSEFGGVCGGACVPQGGNCTTNADCCSQLPCDIAPGATNGTCGAPQGCADIGQMCTQTADCCNGIPCTNGICQAIIQ